MESGGNRQRKREERERNGEQIMCRISNYKSFLFFSILANNAIFQENFQLEM